MIILFCLFKGDIISGNSYSVYTYLNSRVLYLKSHLCGALFSPKRVFVLRVEVLLFAFDILGEAPMGVENVHVSSGAVRTVVHDLRFNTRIFLAFLDLWRAVQVEILELIGFHFLNFE